MPALVEGRNLHRENTDFPTPRLRDKGRRILDPEPSSNPSWVLGRWRRTLPGRGMDTGVECSRSTLIDMVSEIPGNF